MTLPLEDKAAVIHAGWVKGLKSGAPEMVDTFTTIGTGRWFRNVTGAPGPTSRPKAPKPDYLTAEGPTPALAA